MMRGFLASTVLTATFVVSLWGCSGGGGGGSGGPVVIPGAINTESVLRTIAQSAYGKYSDAAAESTNLLAAIEELVADPSESSLARARQQWSVARQPYLLAESLRFPGSPITFGAGNGKSYQQRVDGYPVTVAAIDQLVVGASPIQVNTLKEFPGVVTGFHAIEYVLWGMRAEDEEIGEADSSNFAPDCADCERRGELLRVLTELLIADLTELSEQWNPSGGEFYASFISGQEEQLQRVLLGMSQFSSEELKDNQLNLQKLAASVLNESSAFSNTSHNDLYFAQLGIEQTFYGRYSIGGEDRVVGPGLNDLLIQQGKLDLAGNMRGALSSTLDGMEEIVARADRGENFSEQVRTSASRRNLLVARDSLEIQARRFELIVDEIN